MTEQTLRKMIAAGESTRQEFKSWVNCSDYKHRKELAVKSAVALANAMGGVLLLGVEDDGTITGCPKSDPQALMEAIYDMTRPSLFTEIEPVETSDGVVLVVSVEKSTSHIATSSGTYYRRLGNVTKPYYPANDVYSPADNPDFSAKIVEGASESDIDLLEVYRLKEKLRIRDPGSALPDLADTTFLDNLKLIRIEEDKVCVTVAGLLFEGIGDILTQLLTLPYIYVSAVKIKSLPLTLAVIYNALCDLAIGLVPFYIGNVLDFFKKSYRQNFRLITGFIEGDKDTIREVNRKAAITAVLIVVLCVIIYFLVLLAIKVTTWLWDAITGLF